MVKKSIIEDLYDEFNTPFDREAFAEAFANVKAGQRGDRVGTVSRATRREQFSNLFAQDDLRESLSDALGPVSSKGRVYFGVRGLHQSIGPYLKAKAREERQRLVA